MFLYHRTNATSAILKGGFRNGTGSYMTRTRHRGVWLSNYPLTMMEGAGGDALFRVSIPIALVRQYEWVEERKTYREFLVPASLVNQYGPPRLISKAEENRMAHMRRRPLTEKQIAALDRDAALPEYAIDSDASKR